MSSPRLNRREFIGAGIAAAAAGALGIRAHSATASGRITKLIDIGPGGVIAPGSAQDLRYWSNASYFAETGTRWIRMWADWPSLQPAAAYAPDDPRSPGYSRLRALDEQIALANARGLKVLLMPYRFPTWVNGTAGLAAQKDTDAEISFRPADRMTKAVWDRYVASGRDPAIYNPSRRALEYLLPADPYGPTSAWARFFRFLYGRYHYGRRGRGPYVHGFELVNEPNLQLWPQQAAPPAGSDPFALATRTIERAIARLLVTAQRISASYGHSTMLFAPSISDSDTATSRRYTRYDEFVPALLDACDAIGYRPHSQQAWSHHNYTDVERRQTATRTQLIRGLLAGRWTGYSDGQAPTIFVTEGGARLSRMPELYPAEEPRAAQAKCVRDAWQLHLTSTGTGVAMLAQYLLYADPNFDCGLLDPYPSTVKRPAYEAWRAFPVNS
jgi:hypothetical protein